MQASMQLRPAFQHDQGVETLNELMKVARIMLANHALLELSRSAVDEGAPDADAGGATILRMWPRDDDAGALLDALSDASDTVRDLLLRLEAFSRVTAVPALEVNRSARRFRAPGGTWQDFSRRDTSWRILEALIAHHGRGESAALSVQEIFEIGWAGQRIRPDSLSNRVHVALCELRKRGLKGLLHSSKAGYYLDPRVPIVEVPG